MELGALLVVAQQENEVNPSAVRPLPIPKSLDPGLTAFALVYAREQKANPAARDRLLDLVSSRPLQTSLPLCTAFSMRA